MKSTVRKCSVFIMPALLLVSCYSYTNVRVTRRITNAPVMREKPAPDLLRLRGRIKTQQDHRAKVRLKKNLARMVSLSPVAKINNHAVDLVLAGRFIEAERLFREVIREQGNAAAAYNNLGVVYEIFNRRDQAFRMYSRACILEPDNRRFKKNLFTFKSSFEP